MWEEPSPNQLAGNTWYLTEPGNLRPYEGEWVGVYVDRIVSHGKDPDKVRTEGAQKSKSPEKDIFVEYVEKITDAITIR